MKKFVIAMFLILCGGYNALCSGDDTVDSVKSPAPFVMSVYNLPDSNGIVKHHDIYGEAIKTTIYTVIKHYGGFEFGIEITGDMSHAYDRLPYLIGHNMEDNNPGVYVHGVRLVISKPHLFFEIEEIRTEMPACKITARAGLQMTPIINPDGPVGVSLRVFKPTVDNIKDSGAFSVIVPEELITGLFVLSLEEVKKKFREYMSNANLVLAFPNELKQFKPEFEYAYFHSVPPKLSLHVIAKITAKDKSERMFILSVLKKYKCK